MKYERWKCDPIGRSYKLITYRVVTGDSGGAGRLDLACVRHWVREINHLSLLRSGTGLVGTRGLANHNLAHRGPTLHTPVAGRYLRGSCYRKIRTGSNDSLSHFHFYFNTDSLSRKWMYDQLIPLSKPFIFLVFV